jgi:iron complex outermembrane receptor protein
VFREGIFTGNDVPLVSRNTASVGVAWNIMDKRLVFDGVVRYVGSRRMDNDQTNVQPLIPAFTVVDLRIGGEIEKFFWSLAVQNVFDNHYYDYAIASPYPYGFASAIGTFNAYPQPGRTFMVRAGARY